MSPSALRLKMQMAENNLCKRSFVSGTVSILDNNRWTITAALYWMDL